jgi:hypothetical protein
MKALRVIAIVLMGMSTIFALLGGVGTACIAWNAPMYGPAFAIFVPFMPLYQIFVYVSVVIAMVMSVAVYALIRGEKWAFWGAVGSAIVSLGVAGFQMYSTSTLKGVSFFQTPPTNMRYYTTLFTVIFFLILTIPWIRQRVSMSGPWRTRGTGSTAGGVTAIVTGIIALTTPFWAGEPHTVDGSNLVYVFETPLMVFGWVVLFAGIALTARGILCLERVTFTASLKRLLRIAPAQP